MILPNIKLSLLLSLIMLSSCSGFDIFINGLDSEVFSPVSSYTSQDIEGLEELIAFLFAPLDADNEKVGINVRQQAVLVINRKDDLQDVTNRGKTYSWPEINFNRYSLIVGRIGMPETTYYLAKQKIAKESDHLVFYYELGKISGVASTISNRMCLFATLYHKLPDYPVEMVRWTGGK